LVYEKELYVCRVLRYVMRYVVLNADHKQETDMLSTIFIFFSTCILLLQQYY